MDTGIAIMLNAATFCPQIILQTQICRRKFKEMHTSAIIHYISVVCLFARHDRKKILPVQFFGHTMRMVSEAYEIITF